MQQEDQTLYSLHKKKCLKTDPNFYHQNQQPFVNRWTNDFFSDVRTKIHEKLKTQPDNQPKNKKCKPGIPKKKQKLTISTFQMALDPMFRRVQQSGTVPQRSIHTLIQKNTSIIKNSSNSKFNRNMSAKLVRPFTQPFKELSAAKQVASCRKLMQPSKRNSRPVTPGMTMSAPIEKKDSKQLRLSQKQQNRQNDLKKKHQSQFHPYQTPKMRKSKSQIKNKKSPIKIQSFDTKPLMFYFKSRSMLKVSQRQVSIKKIRQRNKILINIH